MDTEEFPEALFTVGPDRRIRSWLGTAPDLFRLEAGAAVGEGVARLLRHPEDEGYFDRAFLGPAPRFDVALEVRAPVRRAAFTLAPFEDGLSVLARPLEGLAGGRAVPEAAQRLLGAALAELLKGGLASGETVAQEIVEQGRRLLTGFECMLSVVPPQRPHNFVIEAASGPWAATLVGREWAQEGTLAGRALRRRLPLETIDIQAISSLSATLASGGIEHAYLVPLVARRPLPDGRRALGVLGFYRARPLHCTPYERRLIEELARAASLALERAQAGHALADAIQRFQLGVDLSVDLAASLNPSDVVRRLLERTVAACAADRVLLVRVEAGGEAMVEGGIDSSGELVPSGHRFQLAAEADSGGRLLREAVRTRRPIAGEALHPPAHSGSRGAAVRSLRHSLVVPLVLSGELTSALIVSRRRGDAFGARDLATARLLGNVAVLALRNSRLYAEAMEAGRIKSDFLDLAAHELRTPLTVITGYLAMVGEGSFGVLPERWAEPVRMLEVKVAELARLVDDLLLASRLDAGRLQSRPRRFDLRTAARAAVERARVLEPPAAAIDCVLPNRRVPVLADPEQVGRVLDALLQNALAFHRGEPAVRVSVEESAAGGRVLVEDFGRGIPLHHQARIFERFYRGEDRDQPSQPGTGLGLYIGRELAKRAGGSLSLDWSEPGRGSRFLLELPGVPP